MPPSLEPIAKDILNFTNETNDEMYIQSVKEGDYLVHTAPYPILKNILKDGFLTGDPYHVRKDFRDKHVMHPFQVCFSSMPERHLSALPNMPMIMVSHDTYLKIPFKILREKFKVKPVAYDISWQERELLSEHMHQQIIKRELIENEYDGQFEKYIYNPTWMIENEWRVTGREVEIPNETQVFVANYGQKLAMNKITDLPVKIDNMLRTLTGYQNKRWRLNHWFDKLLKDNSLKTSYVEWNAKENLMRLYDVFPIEVNPQEEKDYEKEMSNREKTRKIIMNMIRKDFTKFSMFLHDCTIELSTRKRGSTCPNPQLKKYEKEEVLY